jgi:ATP-dependent Clp protease ATP-binding subunit ClpC
MFERFTNPARRVVVLAQNEAIDLQHNYIGTEHLLLGLLAGQRGVAVRVLEHFGMSLASTRQEVLARVGAGKAPVARGHVPFTPRAKKTLELSLREALQLNVTHIGPEHLLLGIIREGDGVAAQIMAAHGGLPQIRAAVLELLPPSEAAAAARHWRAAATAASLLLRRGPGGMAGPGQAWPAQSGPGKAGPGGAGPDEAPGDEEEVLRATPAADSGLDEAARLAGPGLVGSHHLVLAALTDPGTAAARALAAAGIDLEQIRVVLRDADVTGSTDELPQDAGRRQMLIRVAEDRVTVEMTDQAMIRLAQATLHALSSPDSGGAGKAASTGKGDAGKAETGQAEDGQGEAGQGAAGTPAGAPGEGEIRGDQPSSASLSDVWLTLRDSLEDIAIRAAAAGAGEAGPGRKGRKAAS